MNILRRSYKLNSYEHLPFYVCDGVRYMHIDYWVKLRMVHLFNYVPVPRKIIELFDHYRNYETKIIRLKNPYMDQEELREKIINLIE